MNRFPVENIDKVGSSKVADEATVALSANKANKLSSSKTIAISGGATGTATSFDGSGNITISVTALDVSKATSGTLSISRGGTGLTSSPSILTNLASTTAANVLAASPRPGVTGILSITNGGTGLSKSPSMLVNLASTTADTVLESSPRPGITGILPVANGGTGSSAKNFVDLTSDQTINGAKHFSHLCLLPENNENEGGTIYFAGSGDYAATKMYVDRYCDSIRIHNGTNVYFSLGTDGVLNLSNGTAIWIA